MFCAAWLLSHARPCAYAAKCPVHFVLFSYNALLAAGWHGAAQHTTHNTQHALVALALAHLLYAHHAAFATPATDHTTHNTPTHNTNPQFAIHNGDTQLQLNTALRPAIRAGHRTTPGAMRHHIPHITYHISHIGWRRRFCIASKEHLKLKPKPGARRGRACAVLSHSEERSGSGWAAAARADRCCACAPLLWPPCATLRTALLAMCLYAKDCVGSPACF
jgi:hypothetical protein